MIEQYYAKHKKTGEIFEHKGRYCFSEKGLIQSIRNNEGTWSWGPYPSPRKLMNKPEMFYEIKKVVLE
jgi:hypothetical protein